MRTSAFASVTLAAVLTACSSGSTLAPGAPGGATLSEPEQQAITGPLCTQTSSFPAHFSGDTSIAALGPSDVWVAGLDSTGKTSVLHSMGSVVIAMVPPIPALRHLGAIVAISDSDVWLAGTAIVSGAFLAHWNGSSWTAIPNTTGIIASRSTVSAATASASADVWFAGSELVGKTPELMIERWDGRVMRLIDVGPYGVSAVADILEFSPSNVWMLVDSTTRLAPVHWDGAGLKFYDDFGFGPFPSTGRQLAASSPTNLWLVGNASVTGSKQIVNIIGWSVGGAWEPFTYTPVSNQMSFEGIAAFAGNEEIIDGFNAAVTPPAPLTFVYRNSNRWHSEPNTLGGAPVGRLSVIHGTKSYWTMTTNGSGSTTNAVFVTCK